jgi:hypothetical protein
MRCKDGNSPKMFKPAPAKAKKRSGSSDDAGDPSESDEERPTKKLKVSQVEARIQAEVDKRMTEFISRQPQQLSISQVGTDTVSAGGNRLVCQLCQKPGHSADVCRSKVTCGFCGKQGHAMAVCREWTRRLSSGNRLPQQPFGAEDRGASQLRQERVCWSCHQPGHFASNCPTRNASRPTGSNAVPLGIPHMDSRPMQPRLTWPRPVRSQFPSTQHRSLPGAGPSRSQQGN